MKNQGSDSSKNLMVLWNKFTFICHSVCFTKRNLVIFPSPFARDIGYVWGFGWCGQSSVQEEGTYKLLCSLHSYFKPNQYGGQLSAKENKGRNRANQAVLSNPVIPQKYV